MQQAKLIGCSPTLSLNGKLWISPKPYQIMQTCHAGSEEFFRSNVRVKASCDALGCCDVGWYCVRAILWAFNYEVPTAVFAHGGEPTGPCLLAVFVVQLAGLGL
jgi:hypothetical protein